ncbi:hypothetical protein ANTRET_LOCUS10827 [Anthophora retusa]
MHFANGAILAVTLLLVSSASFGQAFKRMDRGQSGGAATNPKTPKPTVWGDDDDGDFGAAWGDSSETDDQPDPNGLDDAVTTEEPTGERDPGKPTGDRDPRKPTGEREPRRPTGEREPRRPTGEREPRRPTGEREPTKPTDEIDPWRPNNETTPKPGDGKPTTAKIEPVDESDYEFNPSDVDDIDDIDDIDDDVDFIFNPFVLEDSDDEDEHDSELPVKDDTSENDSYNKSIISHKIRRDTPKWEALQLSTDPLDMMIVKEAKRQFAILDKRYKRWLARNSNETAAVPLTKFQNTVLVRACHFMTPIKRGAYGRTTQDGIREVYWRFVNNSVVATPKQMIMARKLIRQAWKEWSRYVNFRFVEVQERDPAVPLLEFSYVNTTKKEYYFNPVMGDSYEHTDNLTGTSTIAHCTPYTEEIVPIFFIHFFDTTEFDYSYSPFLNQYEMPSFYQTALHEIGHFLGIGHSEHRSSVMFPVITDAPTSLGLSNWDIHYIQSLYPELIKAPPERARPVPYWLDEELRKWQYISERENSRVDEITDEFPPEAPMEPVRIVPTTTITPIDPYDKPIDPDAFMPVVPYYTPRKPLVPYYDAAIRFRAETLFFKDYDIYRLPDIWYSLGHYGHHKMEVFPICKMFIGYPCTEKGVSAAYVYRHGMVLIRKHLYYRFENFELAKDFPKNITYTGSGGTAVVDLGHVNYAVWRGGYAKTALVIGANIWLLDDDHQTIHPREIFPVSLY